MSETPEEPNNVEPEEETASDESTTNDDASKWQAEAEKWKALSRKNERALKEAQAKLQASSEPSLEELKAELEGYRAEIAKKQKQEAINSIAKLYELPSEAASLLKGETEEEIEEAAKALSALLGVKAKPQAPAIPTQGLANHEPPKVELSPEEELQAWLASRKKTK